MNTIIEVRNFHKAFGTKKVHRGVNLQILKGECLGLIGGSGTGKSVLLRSLIGLESPDSGDVLVEGQKITNLKERDLIPIRKKIAYAFQGGALFDSMTVYENLAYPLREHTNLTEPEIAAKIESLLEEFGLAGNSKIFPANLSGGMQKRVGLARAIILDPEVILYDEPTAGLDPYNTHKIQSMILNLKKKGKTGVLITHDMPVAFEVCDRIAMLVNGVVETIATVAEIQAAPASHPIKAFALGEVD